jgi:hypothetical protein
MRAVDADDLNPDVTRGLVKEVCGGHHEDRDGSTSADSAGPFNGSECRWIVTPPILRHAPMVPGGWLLAVGRVRHERDAEVQ